jgi:hypothetical protein
MAYWKGRVSRPWAGPELGSFCTIAPRPPGPVPRAGTGNWVRFAHSTFPRSPPYTMAAPFPDTPILPSLALFRIIGPRSRPVRSRNWVRSAQSPLGDPVGLPQIGFVSHDSLPNWVRFAQSASDWSGGMMDYWNGAGVVATRQAGIGFVCTRAHAPHPPGPVPRGPAGGIGFVSHIPLSGDVAPDTPIRPSFGLFRMFRPPARAGLPGIGFVSHDWHRIGIVEW